MHKADHFFDGSTVIFEKHSSIFDPIHFFNIYLSSHNNHFPHLPQLWLCSNGHVPTCSWFINWICTLFPSNNVTGHSLCLGGATALALMGTPLHQIQSASRWSSNAFLIYLQKNPLLIQGSLTGHSAIIDLFFTTSHPSSSMVTDSFLWSLCWSACAAIKMASTGH